MLAVFAWLIACLFLTLFYAGMMWFYRQRWQQLPEVRVRASSPVTPVSIIIPARNEEKNIGRLLQDIQQQDYPKALLEVIVVDDHSEDATGSVAGSYGAAVYKLQDLLPQSEITSVYKKRAIELAIQKASGKLIVTTDADCRVPASWIKNLADAYERTSCKLIAAPVLLVQDETSFENFQVLDFCGMQAITGASLHSGLYNMANGANLAYEKDAFMAVNGFQGIDAKASGDDMLLVYKIAKRFDGAVLFLKSREAIVRTSVIHGFGDFLQQRFRWTSKSGSYQDKRITVILGLIYLFVLSILINISYAINTSDKMVWMLVAGQFIVKSLIDYFFLRASTAFFDRKDLLRSFLTSELLHCWYIVFVGTLGNIMPYTWKGRKLR
jgi:poly-beta-1,6-N-acetyl-D-glucosamine synthase